MKGQWLGKYQGDVEGNIMINIDKVSDHFEAVAYLNPDDGAMPSSVAYLKIENKTGHQKIKAYISPIDPRTGYQCKWEEIKNLYSEDVSHSTEADVDMEWAERKLNINALSDIGGKLTCFLTKPEDVDESKINGTRMAWEEYKSHVSKLSDSKHLFRGQEQSWRLRTSFHRRERYRISQFTGSDVKQLHQRLCAITSHYFDLTSPEQNGVFFNLLQHHGYPTPLLDWSYSPFVSAFFAFRDRPKHYEGDENVRIYIFNYKLWEKSFEQIMNLDPHYPHLSVSGFIALDNPRLIPQQAVTTVSNIDDIEAYILEKEGDTSETFIEAIDIPAKYRNEAMQDLSFMGITAGSMFPGIDGVCEELREKNFEI